MPPNVEFNPVAVGATLVLGYTLAGLLIHRQIYPEAWKLPPGWWRFWRRK